MIKKIIKLWYITPKVLRVIISIIGTIFMSALGTPVWNRMLKPMILSIVDTSFNCFFELSKYIETETYTNIANMSLYNWIFDIKFMIVVILLLPSIIILIFIHQTYKLNEKYEKDLVTERNIEKNLKNKLDILRKFSYISTFITILLFGAAIAQDIYCMQMKVRFENKLVEIRPYITDKEYYMINSKFKKIKSKNDYNNIIEQMNRVNIKL